MAGLYLHIPFCKQKCSYCDFHFSTSLKYKPALVKALCKEISTRQSELSETIETLYIGGGTPSILSHLELRKIVDEIRGVYKLADDIEFTLECNPDDLDSNYLKQLKEIGINRLSIGVQSFRDEELQFFNRSHSAKQAKQSILDAQDAGITNLTIDLIYGVPTLNLKAWEKNLSEFERLDIPHLSAYALTVEQKTVLHHQVIKNQTIMPKDEEVLEAFFLLKQHMQSCGLDHYEISNFGRPGFYSKHNSNYWKGVHYLGFGPSAHSFTKNKRRWNVSNNIQYIEKVTADTNYFEQEQIDTVTAYNEYILTRLRTKWGIDKTHLKNQFGEELFGHFERELSKLKKTSYLQIENNTIMLTQEGMTVADGVAADLFYIK